MHRPKKEVICVVPPFYDEAMCEKIHRCPLTSQRNARLDVERSVARLSGVFFFRPQNLFGFHPHHIDNTERAGEENAQYP